jgi:glycosyltransferase involved in cell wall biosynthesis
MADSTRGSTVSVLMASRNHAEFVADAVRSVLEQDYEAVRA